MHKNFTSTLFQALKQVTKQGQSVLNCSQTLKLGYNSPFLGAQMSHTKRNIDLCSFIQNGRMSICNRYIRMTSVSLINDDAFLLFQKQFILIIDRNNEHDFGLLQFRGATISAATGKHAVFVSTGAEKQFNIRLLSSFFRANSFFTLGKNSPGRLSWPPRRIKRVGAIKHTGSLSTRVPLHPFSPHTTWRPVNLLGLGALCSPALSQLLARLHSGCPWYDAAMEEEEWVRIGKVTRQRHVVFSGPILPPTISINRTPISNLSLGHSAHARRDSVAGVARPK